MKTLAPALGAFALLSGAAATAAPPPAVAPQALAPTPLPPTWKHQELGGGKFFAAQVSSDEKLVNVVDRPELADFSVRCDAKGLFVAVFWPDYVAAETYDEHRADVIWKTDAHKEEQARLIRSQKAAVAAGKDAMRLLKALSTGKVLTVMVPDMHGGQTAVFQIDGIAGLYQRVTEKGCGG
jgi:hypothetical protein